MVCRRPGQTLPTQSAMASPGVPALMHVTRKPRLYPVSPHKATPCLNTLCDCFNSRCLPVDVSVGLAMLGGGPYAWDTISSWLGAEPGAGGADGAACPLLSGTCCAPRMCSRNLHPATKEPSEPIGQPTSHVQPIACRALLQVVAAIPGTSLQPGATDAACRRKLTYSRDAGKCRRRLLGSTA